MHVELLRGRKYVIKNSENSPVNTCNDLILHFRFRGQFHNSYVQGHMITKSVLKLVWPTTVLRDKKKINPWILNPHGHLSCMHQSHYAIAVIFESSHHQKFEKKFKLSFSNNEKLIIVIFYGYYRHKCVYSIYLKKCFIIVRNMLEWETEMFVRYK